MAQLERRLPKALNLTQEYSVRATLKSRMLEAMAGARPFQQAKARTFIELRRRAIDRLGVFRGLEDRFLDLFEKPH